MQRSENSSQEETENYKREALDAKLRYDEMKTKYENLQKRIATGISKDFKHGGRGLISISEPCNENTLKEMYDDLFLKWRQVKKKMDSSQKEEHIPKVWKSIFEKAKRDMTQKKDMLKQLFIVDDTQTENTGKVSQNLTSAIHSLQSEFYITSHIHMVKQLDMKDVPENFSELAAEYYKLLCLMLLHNPPMQPNWEKAVDSKPGSRTWMFPEIISDEEEGNRPFANVVMSHSANNSSEDTSDSDINKREQLKTKGLPTNTFSSTPQENNDEEKSMGVKARLDVNKSMITSVFGDILKMETSEILLNLGSDATMPVLITSVGNEHGQVLISVITKSVTELENMAEGLMSRYEEAKMDPPKVMYVTSDYSTKTLFHKWKQLQVRLDVWHFMEMFASGLTSVNHKLYGYFMANLSVAILKWNSEDVSCLIRAKQPEFGDDGILSIKELIRHCRWHTRGPEEIEMRIQNVLQNFWNAQDDKQCLLINPNTMNATWEKQRDKIKCIQDPLNIDVFTKIGEVTRYGVKLPIYQCARGSAILQTFHSHMFGFISRNVSSASLQVVLLDGLIQWNQNHCCVPLQQGHHAALNMQHRKITRELIGLDYLYQKVVTQGMVDLNYPDTSDGREEVKEKDWERDNSVIKEEEIPHEFRFLNFLPATEALSPTYV